MTESKISDAANCVNRRKTREESFKEINDTQEFYIDELIRRLNDPNNDSMKSIDFTSPTGTGKTNMMALLLNKMDNCFFIITTLSKGQLNHQIANNMERLSKHNNFIVYGLCDYTSNTKRTAQDIIDLLPTGRRIVWLRDEGHINTNKWQEVLSGRCWKVVNFSATNKGVGGVRCNFTNTDMLRTVHQQIGTPEEALDKLLEVKRQHAAVKGYNPCAIMRCLYDDIESRIVDACEERGLKWINITDESFDMSELCKDDNPYDVILNKFKIVEGIDIRRAHVLYMTNKPSNAATTIQVIGRCRRNALLYRDDIDIFAPENDALHEATTMCYVYYNVDKMNIDQDESGELCMAFCNTISCQDLKPNSLIKVRDGRLSNGLSVIELGDAVGTYRVEVDDQTGFNVIRPEGEFYGDDVRRFGNDAHPVLLKVWGFDEARVTTAEEISKLTLHKKRNYFDWSSGRIEEQELPEELWYYDLGERDVTVIEPEVSMAYTFSDDEKDAIKRKWSDAIVIAKPKGGRKMKRFKKGGKKVFSVVSYRNLCLDRAGLISELHKQMSPEDVADALIERSFQKIKHNYPKSRFDFVISGTEAISLGNKCSKTYNISVLAEWNNLLDLLENGIRYHKDAVVKTGNFKLRMRDIKTPLSKLRRKDYNLALKINEKVKKITIDDVLSRAAYLPYVSMVNDRHSAIIGTDLMKTVQTDEGLTTWIEDRSVTSKVGKYSKLQRFIASEYADELKLAKGKLFNGRNSFRFDSRCNSCLGYCVEYYSKYLVYSKNYLAQFIDDAMSESHCDFINDNIIVRACMLKYKDNMMSAFGPAIAKVIRTVSAQQLIQEKYADFVRTVVELGAKAAEFVRAHLETHGIDADHPIHSPVLSVRHIAGLADYIDGHTIIDIKATNGITQHHLMQVLAYHYLSTKRSDLRIDRVIVYDAVSGKDVSIDLSRHKYGYGLPDWGMYDNEEVSEGL